jgi:hypothetical protein
MFAFPSTCLTETLHRRGKRQCSLFPKNASCLEPMCTRIGESCEFGPSMREQKETNTLCHRQYN